MQKHKVDDAGKALAYITDCTLATVWQLAHKKSARKSELARQISIAQTAIDWMRAFRIDYSSTRAAEVSKAGNVEQWANSLHGR